MALFGKKKLSLEEILEGISNLSEEEKTQVKAMFDGQEETPSAPEEETTEETSETETVDESVTEPNEGEETPEVAEGETVEGEVVEETTEPEAQPEEQPVTEGTEEIEAQPEVAPEVKEQEKDLDEAQTVRITALEEKCALLEEKLEQVLSALENRDFGLNPAVPEGGGEDHNRMSAVMRGYAGGNANRYL